LLSLDEPSLDLLSLDLLSLDLLSLDELLVLCSALPLEEELLPDELSLDFVLFSALLFEPELPGAV
jgi:hypothetical protein